MLSIQSRGHGDKVIILGGGPGFSRRYLVDGLAPLESEFELIYIDYPGCGESRATHGAAPFENTTRAVIEALAPHCGPKPIRALCHSFGAVVLGAALHEGAPFAVGKCVLANPSPHTRERCDIAQEALLARLSDEDRRRLADSLAGRFPPAELVTRLLPYYFGRDHDIPALDLEFFPDAYLAVAATLGDFDFRESFASIPSRLYLFGSADFISPSLFDDALDQPGVDASTMDGGHFLFIDAATEFYGWVSRFFRED